MKQVCDCCEKKKECVRIIDGDKEFYWCIECSKENW
jgi:hypothetical protein